MAKRVLDVGQCGFDHGSITRLLRSNFNAEVLAAHSAEDAVQQLATGNFDLVLVNRKLDADHSDGMAIIERMKSDPATRAIPVMLVTNYPQYQQAAVAAGADPGFGKNQLDDPATVELLRKYLG